MKVPLRKGLAMGKKLAQGFYRGNAPPNAWEGEKKYGKKKPKKKKLTKKYYA